MKNIKKITNLVSFKIIVGTIYAILFSEMILRIFSPMPILPRYVSSTSFGIRGNIPNKSYWHKSADFTINMRINSKGMRSDEEIAYKKPEGIKRIVVLGDSFGMGYEVSLEDTFTTRMKENLEKEGKNVQIVNLSVSGHGNAEELIMLENEGFKYEPDLVLLCWDKTDYKDNVRSNLYALEHNMLKRKAKSYLPGVKISDMLYTMPLFTTISDNSHLYTWAREEAGQKGKVIILKLVTIKEIIKKIISGGTSESKSNKNKDIDDYETKLSIALLNKIADECKKYNSKCIVLDIPVQRSRYEFYSVFPDSNKYPRKFPVVSPIEMFHENVVKNELFVWERSHGHFTPKGCRLIGTLLAEYILKNRLL